MKTIAIRSSGKSTFFSGVILSLVNNHIIKYTEIWIFCPKFNNQSQWSDALFKPKNKEHLRIDEQLENKLIDFDDIQTELKRNNVIYWDFYKGKTL